MADAERPVEVQMAEQDGFATDHHGLRRQVTKGQPFPIDWKLEGSADEPERKPTSKKS